MFISNIVNDLMHTFDRSMVSYNIDLNHYTSQATIIMPIYSKLNTVIYNILNLFKRILLISFISE